MAIFAKRRKYTDIDFVNGLLKKDRVVEFEFNKHCRKYFDEHFPSVFFIKDKDVKNEIFQNSFITLWEKIESGQFSVRNGLLIGPDGKSFRGKLTSFLFGIAINKYKEYSREGQRIEYCEEEHLDGNSISSDGFLFGNSNALKRDIIAECVSKMSGRCYQILDMYYYKHRSLDQILETIPTYRSKDALKTEKYKCMEKLKSSANRIYERQTVFMPCS